jgi:glycosyltransferase involved in cell wall biosynthesis
MLLQESMASCIPIVHPALGVIPEIVKLSGGGVTYEPNTPGELAKTLKEMLSDPDKLDATSDRRRSLFESKKHQHK